MPTEFICTHNLTGETHSSMSTWESNTQTDLTVASTKVANHGGKTGALLANGDAVQVVAKSITATVAFCTDPTSHASISQGQIMLKSIAGGTLASGDKVELVSDSSRHVTLNSAPDSVTPVLELHKDDGNITSSFLMLGATTDATNYRVLTGRQDKHFGIEGDGVIIREAGASSKSISNFENYTIIEWIEVDGTDKAGGQLYEQNNVATAVRFMLLHDFTSTGANLYGGGLFHSSFIYDCNVGIDFSNNNAIVRNVTVLNCTTDGVRQLSAGKISCINVYSAGSGDKDFETSASAVRGDCDKNQSSDATAVGTNPEINKAATDELVNIGSGTEDLHLKSGANAISKGANLIGVFTKDIDDETWPGAGAWDIGGDKFVSVGGGPIIVNANINGGKLKLSGGKI